MTTGKRHTRDAAARLKQKSLSFARCAHLSSLALALRSDDHSVMGEPPDDARPRSWEVYAGMPGIDALFSGLSKRTPSGGFFTS